MWHDGGWGGWLAMALMMIVFWGGVISLVVWLARSGSNRQAAGQVTDRRTALDILDERFARGELDQEEYEARRGTLSGGGGARRG